MFFKETGGHVYDMKTLACIFDRLKIPYTISFVVGCIITPCICIGILYLRIFYFAYKIRLKVIDKKQSTTNQNTLEAIRIAKSLFGSFFIFAVCW